MWVIEGSYKIAIWVNSRKIDKDEGGIYLRKNDKIIEKYRKMQAELS